MSKENFSRRRFIGTTAVGLAGITILPSLSSCATKAVAEEGIRLGIIGLGRQAMFLLNGFLQIAGVKVVAGCDRKPDTECP